MAVEGDGLETNPGDLERTRLDDGVDRARIGEQEVPSQRVERIGAAEEGSWLQQGVAEERLVEFRCVDDCFGPLHDRRVAPEVVGVGMGGEHSDNVAAELFADDLERPLGARLVQPGVDEHDLPIVVGKYTDVDAAGQNPGVIGERYQNSQSRSPELNPDR
jgi:hypothetical protein